MNLVRVDDRLIHGQVSVGWAPVVMPKYMIIADDDIASSAEDSELYLLGVPFEYRGRVLCVKDAAVFLNSLKGERFIVVLKDLASALKLYKSGYEYAELNIGGLHWVDGKKELLHYIFMNESEILTLKKITDMGIKVKILDLPGNRTYGPDDIIKKWEKNER